MTRKPDDWMPLFIGRYLANTTHLTRDQHGAYLLLLMAYWTNGGPLPADDRRLAAITKATAATWQRLRPVMAEFFTESDGKWHQKRADKELEIAFSLIEVRAEAGRAGGIAARGKSGRKPNSKIIANKLQNNTPLPSTNNQEPVAAASNGKEEGEAQFSRLCSLLGFDGNDHKNWLEFCTMKARNGLDFERHILPAAEYHAKAGKLGKTLAYIRPKAIELRDKAAIAATAPVIFENCCDDEWLGRLNFLYNHPEGRWPARWGPPPSDPQTKIPAAVLESFKQKANGNGHATQPK